MKASRSEYVVLRGLRYHLRHWGDPDAPQLFMLHGWMDTSASFQFMVDCLQREWHVIAPDWRGFGLSENAGADSYWFADYLGDLDALLEHCAPAGTVNLLGHSMGANVACIYAGVRPQRVARLINLEGFGMASTRPEQAPQRYAKWLDQLREPQSMRAYASVDEVGARLKKNNPRLSDAKAAFLASHWATQDTDGRWRILGDPAHMRVNPVLYRVDEVTACWQAITAPVLWVEADQTDIWRWIGNPEQARAEVERRKGFISQLTSAVVNDAGHMLHHDQPQALAELVERFLA
jgi:pimeloyl-ACP methyl ester carboxylesterase